MEDAFPPSYETAINRDAWTIIAPYIPSSDLCAALLVCRRWHEIFAPFLWGDPASHFGTEDDTVYGTFGKLSGWTTANEHKLRSPDSRGRSNAHASAFGSSRTRFAYLQLYPRSMGALNVPGFEMFWNTCQIYNPYWSRDYPSSITNRSLHSVMPRTQKNSQAERATFHCMDCDCSWRPESPIRHLSGSQKPSAIFPISST